MRWNDPSRLALVLPTTLVLTLVPAIAAWNATPKIWPKRPSRGEEAAWAGVSSCAAFACHGGNGPDGDPRNAYSTWMARDPHSRAGSVLEGELSLKIEARLAAHSGQRPIRANRDLLCLKCHARPTFDPEHGAFEEVRNDGVSCESCHGPAARWLEPHSQKPWKRLVEAEKKAKGMIPTKDPVARATACAGCHVGGPGREVDHDLIAAGHPRLNFELFSFLEALPRHWDESRERRKSPDDEASNWAIGQWVSARGELERLAARAQDVRAAARPTSASSWPEFAGYSCDSCHHDLEADPTSSRGARQKSSLGTAEWGSWYFAMIPFLEPPLEKDAPPRKASPLIGLRQLLAEPIPDPMTAVRLALLTRDQLPPARSRLEAGEIKELLNRITQIRPSERELSRDHAGQTTLAVSALDRSLERMGEPSGPIAQSALADMFRLVEQSRREGSKGWSQEEFARALERYRLHAPGGSGSPKE